MNDSRVCTRCGAPNSPGSRFCGQCAAPLVERTGLSPRDTERRDLTVLFCDMVGSTGLSQTLEPEDLRLLLNRYHTACAEVIQKRGGIVAQFLGDGVLAYFGYPVAHEDNARRAVSAGLELLEAADVLAATLLRELRVQLSVRVGIHSGSVLIGDIRGGTDWLATGEAVNIAARLQAIAEPGTVVISEATHHRAQGFFECAGLGTHSIRGHSHPIDLLRVLGETGATSRLEAAQTLGLTPLVGRNLELSQLLGHWQAAQEGKEPVVLLQGEPGVGKSRLTRALASEIASQPHQVLECRCFADYQSSAFHPLLALLEREIGLVKDDSDPARLAKLESYAEGPRGVGSIPVLASLLSIPLGDRYQPLTVPPARLRQDSLEVLSRWILHLAAGQPTVFLFEDLHWADPSTLEFLGRLVDQPASVPLLLLLTARLDFHAPWSGPRFHVLPVGRLSPEETETLVARMFRNKVLPSEVLRQMLAKSDGVPLFAEEITRSVLDSGLLTEAGDHYELAGPLQPTSIPATIQDSLMARLDRLGAAKSTAQLAAALGRQFRYQLLRSIALTSEQKLQEHLDHLVAAEILSQGELPDATFTFKHALIQDAAYRSLLRANREDHHRRIAKKLQEVSPELAQTQPEVLAHHCAGAGLRADAARHWHAAGLRALGASAHFEAISHLRNALEQLAGLPASAQRGRDEIEIHAALGLALIMTKGFAAPEVEDSYARAAELCAQAEEMPVRVLYGIWAVPLIRGSVQTTGRLALQFERLLQRATDPSTLLIANATLGNRAFYRGEYETARRYLIAAKGLVETASPKEQHERLQRESGFDGLLYAPLYLCWLDGFCGFPDRARREWRATVHLAEQIGQPFVLAAAHAFGAALGHDQGDIEAAFHSGEKERTLGIEGGFPFWLALGTIVTGWAIFRRGETDRGIQQMIDGLDLYRKTGANVPLPYYGSMLVEACLATGRHDQGMKFVEEMLRMAQTNLDCNHLPELVRLKGELLATSGELGLAEPCLQRALALSREQGALTLELRSAMSLVRLQRRKGQGDVRALADLYRRFTEGFDTQDLRDARELLEA